jgi:hypothetical protein
MALVMAAGGCGTAHAPARSAPTATPATPVTDPSARAVAGATALLAAFRPPAGARPSDGMPAGASKDLDQPMFVPNTPDLVTRTRWWTVAGPPEQVMSWVNAHPPAGVTSAGGLSQMRHGATVTELTAMFLPAASGAGQGRMLVEGGPMPGGRTALRVDVQVTWTPPRPTSGVIPPASVLTVRTVARRTARPGADVAPPVRTVSDRALIAEVTRFIEALPTAARGVVHCPMDTGDGADLTFASMGGTPLAKVHAAASGCRHVTFTGGVHEPARTGGPDLLTKLSTLLHVRWPWTP